MLDHDTKRLADVHGILDVLHIDRRELDVIMDVNASSKLPYHGTQHLLATARRAYAGGIAMLYSPNELRTVVLAALWHDVGHGGGGSDDRANVFNSAALFTLHSITATDWKFRIVAANAILTTQHPGGNPLTPVERLLCDADQLQCAEPDGERFIDGLALETGLAITSASTQLFFLEQRAHTSWGTEEFSKAAAAVTAHR